MLDTKEQVWEQLRYQGGSRRRCMGLRELEMNSGEKQVKAEDGQLSWA